MLVKERLIELRKAMDLTRKEIAEQLDIEQSTYGKYELGKRQPSLEVLQRIAYFFGVSSDYLLGSIDTFNYPFPSADIIKSLREKSNFSVKYISEILLVDVKTYMNYENGTMIPDARILRELSKHYDVTTDYLTGLSNDSSSSIQFKSKIRRTGSNEFEDVNKLPPEAQKQIRDLYAFMKKQFLSDEQGSDEDAQH